MRRYFLAHSLIILGLAACWSWSRSHWTAIQMLCRSITSFCTTLVLLLYYHLKIAHKLRLPCFRKSPEGERIEINLDLKIISDWMLIIFKFLQSATVYRANSYKSLQLNLLHFTFKTVSETVSPTNSNIKRAQT